MSVIGTVTAILSPTGATCPSDDRVLHSILSMEYINDTIILEPNVIN